MCPMTGLSPDAIARIVSAALRPPSSFTASAPAWSRRPALRIASAAHVWYDRNGMSAMRNARLRPRAAASVCRTMSSIVTFRVLEWPSTTCPSESPTRITSTPTSSKMRANRASYAVIITIFAPSAFIRPRSRILVLRTAIAPASFYNAPKKIRPPGTGSGRPRVDTLRAPAGRKPPAPPTLPSTVPSRPELPGSQRYVMLRPAFHTLDLSHEMFKVAGAFHKVDLARVDHQERGLVIVEKVFVISIAQSAQVVKGDVSFVGDPPLADPGQQDLGARLEVDDQVRLGKRRHEKLVDRFVEGDLVVLEVDQGEDLVLGQDVVAHQAALEEVPLGQLPLLPVARQEEEELGLESELAGVFVEALEERVPRHLLLDEAGGVFLGEDLRQGRFPDADRSFDRDVAGGLRFGHVRSIVCAGRPIFHYIPANARAMARYAAAGTSSARPAGSIPDARSRSRPCARPPGRNGTGALRSVFLRCAKTVRTTVRSAPTRAT